MLPVGLNADGEVGLVIMTHSEQLSSEFGHEFVILGHVLSCVVEIQS